MQGSFIFKTSRLPVFETRGFLFVG